MISKGGQQRCRWAKTDDPLALPGQLIEYTRRAGGVRGC